MAMLGEDILELRTREGPIREYLKTIFISLWDEKYLFNAKRPFGFSDWQYPIYEALIEHHVIQGELDSDGYINEGDTDKGDRIIRELISVLMDANISHQMLER